MGLISVHLISTTKRFGDDRGIHLSSKAFSNWYNTIWFQYGSKNALQFYSTCISEDRTRLVNVTQVI